MHRDYLQPRTTSRLVPMKKSLSKTTVTEIIANMCLVTGLCGLVLSSRAGNKPVKLVSTNGLEPSKVDHLMIILIIGTNGKSVLSGDIQLGRPGHCQRMVTYFQNWRCLGFER